MSNCDTLNGKPTTEGRSNSEYAIHPKKNKERQKKRNATHIDSLDVPGSAVRVTAV